MNTLSRRRGQGEAVFNRGLLINSRDFRGGVRFGQVTDGLSCTLVVVECGDVAQEDGGYWASGINCVSHDTGTVNSDPTGMFSLHPGGAHGARADGSVSFYSEDVEPLTLGALCTRASDDGPQ